VEGGERVLMFPMLPMIVNQSDLTGFHGTNEKISVRNLTQGTRTYVQIIRLGSIQ
jgi:acetylornithine deacetylase/succinyl-diaminopimelate desuccinylase-like protein